MEEAKELIRNWRSGGILYLMNLGLTELPELPEGVRTVYCYGNKLLSLPGTLPSTLLVLDCASNQLTTLPNTLPAGLK